jgi:hypothetical protein
VLVLLAIAAALLARLLLLLFHPQETARVTADLCRMQSGGQRGRGEWGVREGGCGGGQGWEGVRCAGGAGTQQGVEHWRVEGGGQMYDTGEADVVGLVRARLNTLVWDKFAVVFSWRRDGLSAGSWPTISPLLPSFHPHHLHLLPLLLASHLGQLRSYW